MPILASLIAKEPMVLATGDIRASLLTLASLFNVVVTRGINAFVLVMLLAIYVSQTFIAVLYAIRFD